jgi:hypothetical protein
METNIGWMVLSALCGFLVGSIVFALAGLSLFVREWRRSLRAGAIVWFRNMNGERTFAKVLELTEGEHGASAWIRTGYRGDVMRSEQCIPVCDLYPVIGKSLDDHQFVGEL